MKNAYEKLKAKFERIYRLGHLESIAWWDEATMMPEGGSEARAKAMAEVRLVQQEILSSPETREQIETAKQMDLDEWDRANVLRMERSVRLTSSITPELLTASSLANARCEQSWRMLRKENNWTEFLPLFEETVKLARETARQRGDALELAPYDAMLETYSPGVTTKTVERVFTELRSFLPDFIKKAEAKQQPFLQPQGRFPIEAQKNLGLETMKKIGFDFNHGRLDVSTHPFCGGVAEDTRITTRYNEEDFTSSLMGVIHETGHAHYAQNTVPGYETQPVGSECGMAIHESQSLFWEMQIARSPTFLKMLQPAIVEKLGPCDRSEFFTADNLYRLFAEVKRGYIRVDADEVTYPAHVILRFEIEKDLIEGKMQVKDLPEVWDQKMMTYLGLSTKGNFKDGCMQDVHWPSGGFGYFPSYTLGALIAAQLFAALEKAHPHVRDQIARGDFSQVREWLKKNVWHKGSLHTTEALVEKATGEPLNVGYFKRHLERRYLQ